MGLTRAQPCAGKQRPLHHCGQADPQMPPHMHTELPAERLVLMRSPDARSRRITQHQHTQRPVVHTR